MLSGPRSTECVPSSPGETLGGPRTHTCPSENFLQTRNFRWGLRNSVEEVGNPETPLSRRSFSGRQRFQPLCPRVPSTSLLSFGPRYCSTPVVKTRKPSSFPKSGPDRPLLDPGRSSSVPSSPLISTSPYPHPLHPRHRGTICNFKVE